MLNKLKSRMAGKKILFAVTILLFGFIARAQESAPDFPWDDVTNKVSYTDVVEVDGVTAADLFKRLTDWFNTYYSNPTNVIQSNDTEKKEIVGQHRFDTFLTDKEVKSKDATMQYSIAVACKEGRFKYTITDILKYQSPKIPIEDWLATDPPAEALIPTLIQVDSFFIMLTDDLITKMETEPKVRDDDDW